MKTIVAYTPAPWDHALAVLRLTGPLRKAGFNLVRGSQDGQIDTEQVSSADLVLIQRDFPKHLAAYERILALARLEAKPVVLDLDDWLLELPENHPDRISHYYAAGLFPILRAALEADAVTVSTEHLGDQVSRLNNSNWTLPNYIDEDIWGLIPPSQASDGPIQIVYMGGDTHIPDVELVTPVLVEVLRRYTGRVALHLVGMHPNPLLSSLPNVTCTPFIMDYASYARFASEQHFDLAIAPLIDNPFNRCKSSIKCLEYSALGLPAVYSNIPPYTKFVSDGENGLLASTSEEWLQAIVRLIEDQALRMRIGLAAQENVRRNWLLGDHAHEWTEAYQQIAAAPRRASYDRRTVPASLVIELTRQTQAWQESALATTIKNEAEMRGQDLFKDEIDYPSKSAPVPFSTLRSGLVGTLNRGMQWFSSQLNKRAG